ncbi:MAG TPA: hypothetical protein VG675_16740 [Bryobacteraceae bacterium]|nr:hypothetical protein [Bryobacteraceae bacterium]
MERPGLTRVGRRRCKSLCWKGLFIEAEWDPDVQHSNDGAFWCQYTFTCLGPDGKLVNEFECSPARQCYEEL